MRAIVYDGNGGVAMRDVAEPQAGPGEVVVAVSAVGLCGTDVGAVKHDRPHIAQAMILGHEFVGRRLDNGAQVVVNPLISCGDCDRCREGQTHLCATRSVIGVHRPGALAERVTVPATNVVPIDGLSCAQAAMVEPLATALHAWNLSDRPQRSIAIFGAGAIGLALLHVVKFFGAADVTVTDVSPDRIRMASRLGADATDVTENQTFAATFDAAGVTATRQAALYRVRAGGTAVLIGLHDAELRVAGGPLIGGERRLQGCFGYTDEEFRESVVLAQTLDTSLVHSVPFADAVAAFDELLLGQANPSHIKLQITIDSHDGGL